MNNGKKIYAMSMNIHLSDKNYFEFFSRDAKLFIVKHYIIVYIAGDDIFIKKLLLNFYTGYFYLSKIWNRFRHLENNFVTSIQRKLLPKT